MRVKITGIVAVALLAACSVERTVAPAPSPSASDAAACTAACDAKPLVIVDGREYTQPLESLDAAQIESIEVVKGEAAAKLVGDRPHAQRISAVIVITTRAKSRR